MRERVYKWDNLKFFMMMGIVMEHALIIYNYPRELEMLWGAFISFLMPLFTFISGYWHKPKGIKALLEAYIKPFLLFSAINFIVGYFFYPTYHSGLHLVGYAMWYFIALFVFSLVTPRLLKRFKLSTICIVSLIAVLAYCSFPSVGKYEILLRTFQVHRLIGFYPFFLLGVAIRNHEQLLKDMFSRKVSLAVLLASYAIYLLLCYKIEGFAYKSGFYLTTGMSYSSLAAIMLSYVCIATVIVALTKAIPNRRYSFTEYGARTLSVYVLHMLIVFPLSWGLFSHLPYNNAWFLLLNIIAIPLLSVILFSKCANLLVSSLLSTKWGGVILSYFLSLLLVNSSMILRFLQ